MAEQKTKPTEQTVTSFLEKLPDEQVRKDCLALISIMKKATGSAPRMWGTSIVGFGNYHYKYESGHEGDACLVGFSPRKPSISLYVMSGFTGEGELLKKLGKHKRGKACLYIKKLEDVDESVLEKIVTQSVDVLKKKYATKK